MGIPKPFHRVQKCMLTCLLMFLLSTRNAAEACQCLYCRANATGSMGPSRMGPAAGGGSNSSSLCIAAHAQSSQGCDCQQHQQSLLQQPAGDLQSCQYTCDMGFQLHSALSQIDDSRVEQRRSFGSGFLQQRWQHGEERGAGADWRLAGSAAEWTQRTGIEALTGDVDCAEEGTLAWYEAQIQEVRTACCSAGTSHCSDIVSACASLHVL